MKAARRLLWVDGSAGASGDMILGALVDLGLPVAHLRRALEGLPVDGWKLRSRKVVRCGLSARKVDVRVADMGHGRGLKALKRIIDRGGLEPTVRRRSLEVFRRLIEAEAEAHGMPADQVHLHEAGALDAIVDVVGACVGLEYLGIDRVKVSRLTTGFGSVECAHGSYPVPGPATLLLARGVPIRAGSIEAERLTPTGAAILAAWADEWGEFPDAVPLRVGYGSGDHDLGATPNLLRMVLAEESTARATGDPMPSGEVVVIECTIDDSTPEILAHTTAELLEAGALEVFTTAVTMKKGRAGHQLTVLVRPGLLPVASALLLRESSSFGLRYRTEQRVELARRIVKVRTAYGSIGVKVGNLGGEEIQASPEYEECASAARRHRVTLREVQRAALSAYGAARRPGGC